MRGYKFLKPHRFAPACLGSHSIFTSYQSTGARRQRWSSSGRCRHLCHRKARFAQLIFFAVDFFCFDQHSAIGHSVRQQSRRAHVAPCATPRHRRVFVRARCRTSNKFSSTHRTLGNHTGLSVITESLRPTNDPCILCGDWVELANCHARREIPRARCRQLPYK